MSDPITNDRTADALQACVEAAASAEREQGADAPVSDAKIRGARQALDRLRRYDALAAEAARLLPIPGAPLP